jgi:hypothetical protein
MSPNHVPSASRRITLTAPIDRARPVPPAHAAAAANLWGTVAMRPSTLRARVAARTKSAKSAAATWMGTTIASSPRRRRPAVTPPGAFTWAIRSPAMKMTRVPR